MHEDLALVHDSQGHGDGERLEVAAAALTLLADHTRLALLQLLGKGEADISTLAEGSEGGRPAVSRHLANLRLARLVATGKDGLRRADT
jgi:DNA-binding transcriptional ArsR family regulator